MSVQDFILIHLTGRTGKLFSAGGTGGKSRIHPLRTMYILLNKGLSSQSISTPATSRYCFSKNYCCSRLLQLFNCHFVCRFSEAALISPPFLSKQQQPKQYHVMRLKSVT